MKKLLLFIAILVGAFSISYSQEVFPCQTDQKMREYVESLTSEQRIQYELKKQENELKIENYIANHPELLVNSTNRGTISYTIPVVFHILHQGGEENISNEQVLNALQHMNDDFQKLNANAGDVVPTFLPLVADVEIAFKLAKLDHYGNCTNGITRTFTPVTKGGTGNDRIQAVQSQHGNWPGNKYLNIFVFDEMDVPGAAGYTYLPNADYAASMRNGIHIVHNYVGSIGTAGAHGAHTLTHEVGHWLNLDHPWGPSNEPGLTSNCDDDDGVADTPNTIGWTSCDLSGTTCDSELDNVENFMEYSYCSKMFTLEQKARMHAALNITSTGRKNVVSAANLVATGVNLPDELCAAEFDVNKREVCQGQSVTFEDLSYNKATAWKWSFPGASPSTSTAKNPTVVYNTPGKHAVTLEATDGGKTITETKTAFITVLDDAKELPFVERFEDYSSISSQEDWRVKSSGTNAQFEITTSASYTGSKSLKLANFGQPSGNVDEFISSPIDLSSITADTKVTLSFRYAYRKRIPANYEYLKVLITNSCGETWAQRKTLMGNLLGAETSLTSWTPSSTNDWTTVHMTNITSAYWVDNFKVKFEFESDGGNNLFIDDINIYAGDPVEAPLSIEDNGTIINSFYVYPNPADNVVNVGFSVQSNGQVNVSLVNVMGQNIQSVSIQASAGENIVMLDTDSVEAGIYFVKIEIDGAQQAKRLIIK